MRLTAVYAKIVDRLTVQEAPIEKNGVINFNFNKDMCLAYGYMNLIETQKIGDVAVYNVVDGQIVQSWVSIDVEVYKVRATELIRAKYSVDEELAFHRKRDSHPIEFKGYFDFCEGCKKTAKMEQLPV